MIEQTINENKQEEKKLNSAPDEVNDALFDETTNAKTHNKKDQIQRFDVSVKNFNAQDFFLGLSPESGVNIVVHPEVSGKITLDLTRVSIDEIFKITRDIYGYDYKLNGNIYTVFPRVLKTEVFFINYLDVQRVGVSDTSIVVGTISGSDNDNNSNANRNQDNNNNSNLLGVFEDENATGINSVPGTRVQTLNRTDFWQSLTEAITAVIGGDRDGRQVVINAQAGMVVVKAMATELASVREFLIRSELSVRRQVILETKVVEVELSDSYQAGINWEAISGQASLFNNVSSFSADSRILEASENGEVFASIVEVTDITTLLDLLATQGSVQVLSSPRISTVNNQKAVIRVGSDEFFVTGIESNTTANASSTTINPTVELESFFSGIALDVTPQISDDNEVILHIHPVVTEVVDQQKTFVVGNQNFDLPLAFRDIRESDSIVRAKSGQVVVLGGLMQESRFENLRTRPFLSSIPGISHLFRNRNKQMLKTELVILLRPIVVTDGVWDKQLNQVKEQINQFNWQP